MEQELFARAPIPRAYFKMALPVVLSMLVSLVYNLSLIHISEPTRP